jgi:hypothetical protein
MGPKMRRDLIERYRDRLHGVLSCYDRIVVTGTLPQACYAEGMTAFLKAQGVRIFDYPGAGTGACGCARAARSWRPLTSATTGA